AGIEAALAARQRGYSTLLLEAGEICDSMLRWGHVRLFSAWKLNVSRRGREILAAEGKPLPDGESYVSARELVSRYFLPLAHSSLLQGCLRSEVRAVSAGRVNTLKGELIADARRGENPFRVLWERDGEEGTTDCSILIDATGVYRTPNATGSGGIPAPGERQVQERILRHLPDPLGRDRGRLTGRRILVVGAGYSAATAVIDLAALSKEALQTQVTWAVRSHKRDPVAEIAGDPLPERRELSRRVNALAADLPSGLAVVRGASVVSFVEKPGGLEVTLETEGNTEKIEVDEILSLTGYRPHPALTQELQIHHCYATEGLMKISAAMLSSGALLAGGGGDCLKVEPASEETLVNPEPRLFVIGSKSFGRFSHYLMRSGIEQVDLIFGSILPRERRQSPSTPLKSEL
ncbi:MAG: FAD-dependent oxidoreductase, partial [Planctomycetota bacterium]